MVIATNRNAANEYDAAGRLKDVTDPKGLISRTEYDALGRATKIEAFAKDIDIKYASHWFK